MKAWILIAYTLAVLAILLTPGSASPDVGAYDKVGHVVLFAGFTVLFAWTVPYDPWVKLAFAFAAGLALGLVTEALQAYVPGRTPEWWDLVADAVGCLVGVGAMTMQDLLRRRRAAD